MQNPIATIEMADGGIIRVELLPEIAPNTVNNFISLAKKGYYDGLIFHRVIKDFMIQGGCPDKSGAGGPGYSIRGEFDQNGHPNSLSHTPGVISMARTNDPDSAGSQFFIMHGTHTRLDGAYAAFGKTISGQEVVDKIACTATNASDRPLDEKQIARITIESDREFPEPVTISR